MVSMCGNRGICPITSCSSKSRTKVEFLIAFVGYGFEHDSQQADVEHCQQLVKVCRARHHDSERPIARHLPIGTCSCWQFVCNLQSALKLIMSSSNRSLPLGHMVQCLVCLSTFQAAYLFNYILLFVCAQCNDCTLYTICMTFQCSCTEAVTRIHHALSNQPN